jgi:tRNA pseudouridine55 synthase
MATGVLLVCLGQATRVAEFLVAGRKRYRAMIVLGTTTDTYDGEGKVLTEGGRTDFSYEEIRAALSGFVGRVKQVPPMFSARKQQGRPLYQLARQGKTVHLESRDTEIYEIAILDWSPPAAILKSSARLGPISAPLLLTLGKTWEAAHTWVPWFAFAAGASRSRMQ